MVRLRQFFSNEAGQDLIEYALLLGFVALGSAALMIGAGDGVHGIWTKADSQLVVANSQAGGPTPLQQQNDHQQQDRRDRDRERH